MIGGTTLPDVVKRDLIVETYWEPRLVSPVCVVWLRVLFPNVRYLSRCPLNPGTWCRHVLSVRPSKKMIRGVMSSSLVTTPNTKMWIGCLVFITIGTSCRDREANVYSVSSASDPGRMFSHLRKNKESSVGGDDWICRRALQRSRSSCLSWPVTNISPFPSYDKY